VLGTELSPHSERIKTAIVTVLCLTGAAIGSILLYRDRSAAGRAGEGPALAMIERREASVRRKPARSYLWTNAVVLEDLYRRDAIQTNAESSVLIRFADNTLLEVGENSLVVIDKLKDIDLGVMRGSLVLREANGEDKQIVIDSQGKAKVERIKLKLEKPEPLARLLATIAAREVEFSWKNPGKGPFHFEISTDRAFPPTRTRALDPADPAAKLILAPGRYFWRVSAQGASSETRQFRVAQVFPLTPVYPAARDKISRWGGDEALQFRWIALMESESGAKHVLELADDAAFQQNKHETPVSAEAGAALLEGVKPGKHFWRLKSQYGDVELQSKAEAIEVSEAGDLPLKQAFPDEGAKIEVSRSALRFGWESETPQATGPKTPVVDFEFELQDGDGKVVTNSHVRERVASWAQPKAGRYKWRVSALVADKRVGQTAWRTLLVQDGKPAVLLEPADKKDTRYWVEPTAFRFKWTDDSTAARERLDYQLEAAKDLSFKSPLVLGRTKDTSFPGEKAKFDSGKWFWRVTVLDPQGAPLRSSEPRQILAGQYPVLTAPSVEKTKAPSKFDTSEDEQSLVLTWAPVAEAQGYEVTLLLPGRSPAAGGPTVIKKNVTGTRAELPGKDLKPGAYEWQVRAIDRAQRPGETSAATKLEVTDGGPLGAPEITSEEVQ
jgi:hypothetical protein